MDKQDMIAAIESSIAAQAKRDRAALNNMPTTLKAPHETTSALADLEALAKQQERLADFITRHDGATSEVAVYRATAQRIRIAVAEIGGAS